MGHENLESFVDVQELIPTGKPISINPLQTITATPRTTHAKSGISSLALTIESYP